MSKFKRVHKACPHTKYCWSCCSKILENEHFFYKQKYIFCKDFEESIYVKDINVK